MDLHILWFFLITVLFTGFFVLEGFDFGVGMLMPFLGKTDDERRSIIRTIGPFWDGNEVWLITAGGAMFAAFPNWYATLFGGFYLPLIFVLLALIVRGVAFEFRNKDSRPGWRATWDWCIFIGSFVPALLAGVAVSNLIAGVPIDSHMNYVGGFFNLLNPFALLGGVLFVAFMALHGAIFLTLKADPELSERARQWAIRLWTPAILLMAAYVITGYYATDLFGRLGVDPGIAPLGAGAALLAAGWLVRARSTGWAFIMMVLTIVFSAATLFMGMFPRVMISSPNPAWSLTIYNASSSQYTLTVMSIIALIFVPIVLLYQGWSYWIFRERVTRPSGKPGKRDKRSSNSREGGEAQPQAKPLEAI
ncbi:MAG TPA: cytochrome d ubiquinol oxidase subunit II [Ktedonobacterales bacterium]|nr:cytochrome d ubiquinol oxidase subunit II [Ktedonobacterales bacterium]